MAGGRPWENGEPLKDYKEKGGVWDCSQRRQGPGNFIHRLGDNLMTFLRTLNVTPATFSHLTPGPLGLWIVKAPVSYCWPPVC